MQRGKRILLSHAIVGSRPWAGSDFTLRYYRIKIRSKTTNKKPPPIKHTYTHSKTTINTKTPQQMDDRIRNWVSLLLDSNREDWPYSMKFFRSPLKHREPRCFIANSAYEEA